MDKEDRQHIRHCSEELRIANDLIIHASAALHRADWDMCLAQGFGLEMRDITNNLLAAQGRIEDVYESVVAKLDDL